MKLFCILLSCLVVMLAVRPCCDDKDCASGTTTVKTTDTHSIPSKKECGGCSPFFSCGTCAGFVVVKAALHKIPVAAALPLTHNSAYRQPYQEQVALSIWQPPQLG